MTSKICDSCPFKHENIGKPQPYSSDDIMIIIQREEDFVCHELLDEDTPIENQLHKPLCRGYVSSMRKGCKMFKRNPRLIANRPNVTEEDIAQVFPHYKYGQIHKC